MRLYRKDRPIKSLWHVATGRSLFAPVCWRNLSSGIEVVVLVCKDQVLCSVSFESGLLVHGWRSRVLGYGGFVCEVIHVVSYTTPNSFWPRLLMPHSHVASALALLIYFCMEGRQALPNWIVGPSRRIGSVARGRSWKLFKRQRRCQPIRSPYANTLAQTLANRVHATQEN